MAGDMLHTKHEGARGSEEAGLSQKGHDPGITAPSLGVCLNESTTPLLSQLDVGKINHVLHAASPTSCWCQDYNHVLNIFVSLLHRRQD